MQGAGFVRDLGMIVATLFIGVVVGLTPGYLSEVLARADHDDFAVGVAVVYDVAPSKAQQVEDCERLADAFVDANVKCVRVR